MWCTTNTGNHLLHLAHHPHAANRPYLVKRNVALRDRFRHFNAMVTPVACFSASHTKVHKQDLCKMDVVFRLLLCSIVGPPGHVDWPLPWQEILHHWNEIFHQYQLPWLKNMVRLPGQRSTSWPAWLDGSAVLHPPLRSNTLLTISALFFIPYHTCCWRLRTCLVELPVFPHCESIQHAQLQQLNRRTVAKFPGHFFIFPHLFSSSALTFPKVVLDVAHSRCYRRLRFKKGPSPNRRNQRIDVCWWYFDPCCQQWKCWNLHAVNKLGVCSSRSAPPTTAVASLYTLDPEEILGRPRRCGCSAVRGRRVWPDNTHCLLTSVKGRAAIFFTQKKNSWR